MRTAHVSLPFGQLIPCMFCPVCGSVIKDEMTDQPECNHILFTYYDICNDFNYIRSDLEDLVKQAETKSGESGEHPLEELLNLMDTKSAICLAVTGSGMACGPVSYTDYVGIDFAELDEE